MVVKKGTLNFSNTIGHILQYDTKILLSASKMAGYARMICWGDKAGYKMIRREKGREIEPKLSFQNGKGSDEACTIYGPR